MKSKFRFKTTIVLSILVSIGAMNSRAMGQTTTTTAVTDARSHTIYKDGIPTEITFPDGRIAAFVVQKENRVFKTTLHLADNTCTTQQEVTCEVKFPYQARRFGMVWIKNPKHQGAFVLTKDHQDDPTETPYQNIFGVGQFPLYSGDGVLTTDHSTYGEITCSSNEWAPWKSASTTTRSIEAAFWDEDFENSNREFLYYADNGGPSFNSFRSRFEGISFIETPDKRLLLSQPKNTMVSKFFSYPLIAYKLQLTFLSPSLTDPRDQACEVTFATEFSKIFEEFSALSNFDHKKTFDVKDFKSIEGNPEDAKYLPYYWKSEGQWSANSLL